MPQHDDLELPRAFAALVLAHGLADRFGLALMRREPPLPPGHVYVETEASDRTLEIRVMPEGGHPAWTHTLWCVDRREPGTAALRAVQPCIHIGELREPAQNYVDPAACPAFVRDFLALMAAHDPEGRYALTRVHRHFAMAGHEVLLEGLPKDSTVQMGVVDRSAVGDAQPAAWYAHGGAAVPYTTVVQYRARASVDG